MKNKVNSILALSLLAFVATSAQAQVTNNASVAAWSGTQLLNSAGTSGTSYVWQIGTFSGNWYANDWTSWNSGGANAGFTQLATGNLTGGALSVDGDGYVFNFSYTSGPGGQLYTSAGFDGNGVPTLADPILPYLIITAAATGSTSSDTREVLVGEFQTAMLGYDPEGIEFDTYLGIENDIASFSVLVGTITGSEGATVLGTSAVAIPEPSSLSLLVAGGAALAALRRRKA